MKLLPEYFYSLQIWDAPDVISTIRSHLDSICNYFLSRTTNGAMEGINNRLKLIKRQAYGFVNFDNMRSRFLACFS
jgi:transposase